MNWRPFGSMYSHSAMTVHGRFIAKPVGNGKYWEFMPPGGTPQGYGKNWTEDKCKEQAELWLKNMT